MAFRGRGRVEKREEGEKKLIFRVGFGGRRRVEKIFKVGRLSSLIFRIVEKI